MTKTFLIDENVNQKVIRLIPAAQKGFIFHYPQYGGFKGAKDQVIKKLSLEHSHVLVTCDRDFNVPVQQMPNGVLWIRPSPRISQRRVGELVSRFCSFVQTKFPENPYDFRGKLFEIHEFGVTITSESNTTTSYEF